MSYRDDSEWNEKNELKCLFIFKKLEAEKFPRGKQMEYCREMERSTNLDAGNISAKVSNYKSVANINNASNASENTKEIYKKYNHLSLREIQDLINSL
jgi:hypothetical protein